MGERIGGRRRTFGPVVLVGLAYTYRRLQGEPLVDPAPRTA